MMAQLSGMAVAHGQLGGRDHPFLINADACCFEPLRQLTPVSLPTAGEALALKEFGSGSESESSFLSSRLQ